MQNKIKKYASENIPLPPVGCDILTTVCDYCIVGCGYKVYRWPIKEKIGTAKNNTLINKNKTRKWVSPNQHNIVMHNNEPHYVVILPDADASVVNLGGDHSIRGGTIAQKCYNPLTPTKDRLQYPMVRINKKLVRISWDDAIEIMADISQYVIKKRGEQAWAMKMYSYQYWENTHALTKLALRKIKTPAWAVHDQPTGHGPDTPGMADAGIDNFSASYDDWGMADTLLIVGTDPYESKTIIFNDFIKPGIDSGMKVIFVVPRKTTGVAYAEQNGGLHLEITPGTDAILLYALARIIVENGWEDKNFVSKWINNTTELNKEVFQADGFEDFKSWVITNKDFELDNAVKLTGIPKEKILLTAELLAKPNKDGSRKKSSFGFEKGLYWSNNYLGTASLTSLGLICGAGNRPGQVISRFGGHQRGMMPGGKYPKEKAPEKFPGWKKQGIDLDRWVEQGNASFVWVVGNTWTHAMTASKHLEDKLRAFTSAHPVQPSKLDKEHIIEVYKKRVDDGGLVMVDQDIYPVSPIGTEFSDIVLPAATWGEENFTRANGERRVRLYQKFYDSPGESLPDWKIAAKFAKKMGFSGFDWKDSNEVFEDAAFYNKGRRTSYVALVEYARSKNMKAHDLLKTYGTEGIQAPIRWEDGELKGTKRLHDDSLKTGVSNGLTKIDPLWLRKFKTETGRANLLKAPWELYSDYWEFMKPVGDELWVTSGRINELWQSGFDDQMRRPYLQNRWPENFLEIHPNDAKKRGIESGDWVEISSEKIPVEVNGYTHETKSDKADGIMPLQTDSDIEMVDELESIVKSQKYEDTIHSTKTGSDAFEMDDPMLESAGISNNIPLETHNDPIMQDLHSTIGLSWSIIKPMTFTELLKNNRVELYGASFKAVAIVTDAIKEGVTFTYFNLPSAKGAPNSLAGRIMDPVSQRPRYKLARGIVKNLGESEYKHSLMKMSFKPRNII
ncbi:MAG: arsenate reductase (azurin) large subunit [Sulfurimonas sp.]|nr:arsenate reductase (azurin) large subunit [Sulfurimonas sp.]